MSNAVRKDYVMSGVVKGLAFIKQLAGKVEIDEVCTASSRRMHDEDSIGRLAIAVFLWLAKRSVMYPKFR